MSPIIPIRKYESPMVSFIFHLQEKWELLSSRNQMLASQGWEQGQAPAFPLPVLGNGVLLLPSPGRRHVSLNVLSFIFFTWVDLTLFNKTHFSVLRRRCFPYNKSSLRELGIILTLKSAHFWTWWLTRASRRLQQDHNEIKSNLDNRVSPKLAWAT